MASGPAPPACIPMTPDGQHTHIYCQPLEQTNSIMTSTPKVPSTIVPIDVSGQPFSRMASFRRSFIHVDFFTRRKKKKDKRRNTVTEGNTKELKEALHNILNEKSKYPKETNLKCEKSSNHENNHNIHIVNGETNNNSSDKSTCSAENSINCLPLDGSSEEKNSINTSKCKIDANKTSTSETTKLSSFTKRKTKGRIPISTVSAAMSVAVEMRQLDCNNKSEDQSSSGNWSYSSDLNSSDSENRRNSVENNGKNMASEMDSNYSSLSKENLQNRLKEVDASVTKGAKEHKEMESLSCASSENNGTMDDRTSNATSADSEVFFISSDESDEDISDLIFEPNYGSSLSVTTASNGSLNSLLSQTATEMASSTGTLTSIGLDRLPTPPPPPPLIITAKANQQLITSIDKNFLVNNFPVQNKKKLQAKNSSKKESKSVIQKNSKSIKMENADTLKTTSENSKNIFSSFVNMKTRTKERNKPKSAEKINKTISQPPPINMYGSDSPQNIKQIPSFIKETASPIINNKPKNCMQSFSSNSSQLKPKTPLENKPNLTHFDTIQETKSNLLIQNTGINSTNDFHSERKDIEVPLKYVHRVTVTPIQRHSLSEQNNSFLTCRKALFKENEQRIIKDNDFKQAQNLNMFRDEQHSFERPKPQRPMTLQTEKPKAAARVLLDPEGRVLQCTNSLDRKLHCAAPPEKYNYTREINNYVGYLPNQVVTNESEFNNPITTQSIFHQPLNAYQFNNDMINRRYSSPFANFPTMYEPGIFDIVQNNYSASQQKYKENYYPQAQGNSFYITETAATAQKLYGAQSLSRQNLQIPRKYPIVITPDPNISGLPLNDAQLTQRNVKMHSQKMERYNMPATNSAESNTCSPKSLNSPMSADINKSPTTMSTEDLFAVIHNCKKRMNIKTDSDISLTSSSRSSSPSCLRPSSARGALAETGFLSPRNSSFDSRDRRSWADFRPSRETCGERKSLASDRLGPTKPTSMHDFKMLLLQTRGNRQILGPRKSAVEMLKVPSPGDRNNIMPLNPSPQPSSSHSVPNSPSSEYFLCNGHSTVPFKRNNRARSTLQPRYTMYPPIFEDCSEDLENTRDMQQNTDKYIDGYKNTHMQPNKNNLCEDTSQNLRHWV